MNLDEVVREVAERNRRDVVLDLFAESVRQPREAAHGHADRKVMAFDIAGIDVLGTDASR